MLTDKLKEQKRKEHMTDEELAEVLEELRIEGRPNDLPLL